MLVQASTEVFNDPAVRRTTTSVLEAGNFMSRNRMWIRREQIEQLVVLGSAMTYGSGRFLFLITYIFLLRLPSEALPLTVGKDTSRNEIFVEDEALVIVLARRKNKANGSRLSRCCWCSRSRTTCPVHVVVAQTDPWHETVRRMDTVDSTVRATGVAGNHWRCKRAVIPMS